MPYFCYISQSKVDQLIDTRGIALDENWTETTTKKIDKKGSAGLSGLFSIIGANASYGRSDVIQRNASHKRSYAQKLQSLLQDLSQEEGAIAGFSKAAFSPGKLFYFSGDFRCDACLEKSAIAKLVHQKADVTLELSASLAYFSESPLRDGQLSFDSVNSIFFQAGVPAKFETVFIAVAKDDRALYGSPLFLSISEDDQLRL